MTVRSIRAVAIDDARTAQGRTLPQLLCDRAREHSRSNAIVSKRAGVWRRRPWSDVIQQVRLYARGLSAVGFVRDEVIAIVSENMEEQFLLQMAALCVGGRVVAAYPDASAEELGYLLDHSQAAMVVGEDQEQIDKILSARAVAQNIRMVFHIDGRGLWNYQATGLNPLAKLLEAGRAFRDDDWLDGEIARGQQGDVAVYCYTSGTTGRPKAAMLSHAFILDNAYRLMASLGVQPGARYLSYISPAWAAEQYFGFGLAMLAPMVLHYAEKPETVQKDLREVGPEYLLFTPRQWEMLASSVEARMMDASRLRRALFAWGVAVGRASQAAASGQIVRGLLRPLADLLILRGVRDLLGLSKTKGVLSGGSGLSAELFTRFHAFGVPLGNLYGSTELGLVSSHRPGSSYRPETMGELMPSDPTIAPPMEAWVDSTGELRLRLPVFSGYLRNDEATRELGNPDAGYSTGDAVRLDDKGQLIFLDRVKDMRRLRSGQVYPPQFIENHLRAASMIRDAIVIGDESHDFITALVNINSEISGRFAEINGLAYGTFTELSQLPAVRAEIGKVIATINRLVEPGARVVRFATLPKELDADESELTRSRKLRRETIHERYRDLIDGLYAGRPHCDTEIQVRYQDGTTSLLRARVALNEVEAVK